VGPCAGSPHPGVLLWRCGLIDRHSSVSQIGSEFDGDDDGEDEENEDSEDDEDEDDEDDEVRRFGALALAWRIAGFYASSATPDRGTFETSSSARRAR